MFYPLEACLAEQSTSSRVIDHELQVHGEAEGSDGLWSGWGQRPTIQLGPLVGKLEIFFATLWSKHISDFHKRWGNGGSFDWFAADYLMYSGNYGML